MSRLWCLAIALLVLSSMAAAAAISSTAAVDSRYVNVASHAGLLPHGGKAVHASFLPEEGGCRWHPDVVHLHYALRLFWSLCRDDKNLHRSFGKSAASQGWGRAVVPGGLRRRDMPIAGLSVRATEGEAHAYWSPENFGETGNNDVLELQYEWAFNKVWYFKPKLGGRVGHQRGDKSAGDFDYSYWNVGLVLGFNKKPQLELDIRYWDTGDSNGFTLPYPSGVNACDERIVVPLKATFGAAEND